MEQPSRADTREKRSSMNDYDKAVDVCMSKTDEEVEVYMKSRHGKSVALKEYGHKLWPWGHHRYSHNRHPDKHVINGIPLELQTK